LRIGHSLADTYAAIGTVVHELLAARIIPIVLGGSQDLTYGQYAGYKLSEQIINIVSVDARFDLGMPEEPTNSDTYLGKIILEQPNYLQLQQSRLPDLLHRSRQRSPDEENALRHLSARTSTKRRTRHRTRSAQRRSAHC
jgi:arginase family enzyme